MCIVMMTIPWSIIIYRRVQMKLSVGIVIRPGYMSKPISKKMENFLSVIYMMFGVLAVSLVVCGGVYGMIDLIL